jgi:hypothetical protein
VNRYMREFLRSSQWETQVWLIWQEITYFEKKKKGQKIQHTQQVGNLCIVYDYHWKVVLQQY